MKRCLVNVLFTHFNLLEAIREVEVGVKIRVLKLIEGVVHMQKWVNVLTRNIIKATVINAKSK
jgi:hypothetical protein